MEGKLIKLGEGKYYITTDKQTDLCYHKKYREILKVKGVGEKSGEVHHEKGWNKPNEVVFIDIELSTKLSLTNCQAIEHGYDLDELAEKVIGDINHPCAQSDLYLFKLGFQKALELMGDKKFTEEDMKRAFEVGEDFGSLPFSSCSTSKRLNKKEFIQSLQQTEWDVTFDPEEKDAEGRLILKRK